MWLCTFDIRPIQVEQHQADMASLTKRLTTEREKLQECHHQEVLQLEREAADRNSRLSEAVSVLKARIIVISPEMEQLRKQYLTLKTHCLQLPTVIRSTVELTTKQVGMSSQLAEIVSSS